MYRKQSPPKRHCLPTFGGGPQEVLAACQRETFAMSWVIPFSYTIIFGLITYLIWRKVDPDTKPHRDPLMPLMLAVSSLVIWGIYSVYHLTNWYWGIEA